MHIVTPKDATLSGRSVELIPSDVQHHGLGKFRHGKDSKILEGLEHSLVTVPAPKIESGRTEAKGPNG